MLSGDALRDALLAMPAGDRDAWVDQLLGVAPPPPDSALPPGAVPYLPCGVDEILAMMREVPLGPDDVFVDLGSGLGRVVMLVHLLSGARTVGIEIQPHLVEAARATSRDLAIDVTFERGDVLDATLAGNVFFLYAPFNGALLARVLEKLRHVRRPFVVCAVDLELDVDWLVRRPSSHRALAVYDTLD